MIKNIITIGLGLLLGGTSSTLAWRSALYPANWTPGYKDAQGRFLHDFSYAGYHAGEKDIPTNPPGSVRDVTRSPYSADNTGSADVSSKIQQAINDAGNAGGGIVYLPAGTYRVRPGSKNYALHINKSRVVLRGAGPDKTFIFCDDDAMRRKNIIWISPSTSFVRWNSSESNAKTISTDLMSPTKVLPVSNTTGYSVGNWIVVRTNATSSFLADHQMSGIWSTSWGGIMLYRKITGVSGNNITIDAPTRYWMKTRDNLRIYKITGHLQEIGLEDFAIGMRNNPGLCSDGSEWTTSGTCGYEVHGSHAITYNHVVNCWARRLHTYQPKVNTKPIHVQSNTLRLYHCRHVTVTECVFKLPQYRGGGGNGYHFTLEGNDCLVSHCTAQGGRHNYDHKSMQTSGNVTYKCTAMMAMIPSDFHMHLSPANLFDSMEMIRDMIEAKLRGESHGHSTSQSVIWNTNGIYYALYKPYGVDYIVDSGQFDHGYVIGTKGAAYKVHIHTTDDKGIKPDDWLEGEGTGETLEPQSLYEDQLFKRTGRTAIRRQYAESSWQPGTTPGITVYPNPMREQTKFRLPDDQITRENQNIFIYDNAGNIKYSTHVGANGRMPLQWCGTDIAGNPVKPGVYFYEISSGALLFSGRIIKLK